MRVRPHHAAQKSVALEYDLLPCLLPFWVLEIETKGAQRHEDALANSVGGKATHHQNMRQHDGTLSSPVRFLIVIII
jgi:hypothetical protein